MILRLGLQLDLPSAFMSDTFDSRKKGVIATCARIETRTTEYLKGRSMHVN